MNRQVEKSVQAEPIRVGFVMHVMQVAGAEVLVKQMIETLSQEIEATVFCLDDLGELGKQLQDQGTPVVVLGRKPGLDLQVAKTLASEVKKRQIQVLHAHQYTPFFYSALSRMIYGANAKIIFTEHGRHYPDVVSVKRRLINRLVLQRYADVSTACCDFSTHALRTVEGFTSAITLRNGVDLRRLNPKGDKEQVYRLRESLGMKTDIPYAACIARFHPVKDHQTLIKAWKIVNQSCPKAKLLLVGDGEFREQCEQLVIESGISDSVEFWGIRKNVSEILRASDVFTLTSVSEAASLTLLEAMASGCPSVLTDVGGNGEHVTHGHEGLLAPRGNHEEIANHLLTLLRDPTATCLMGQKARKRVEDEFSIQHVIESYSSHFRALAGSIA